MSLAPTTTPSMVNGEPADNVCGHDAVEYVAPAISVVAAYIDRPIVLSGMIIDNPVSKLLGIVKRPDATAIAI
jgi:hypothetical protein